MREDSKGPVRLSTAAGMASAVVRAPPPVVRRRRSGDLEDVAFCGAASTVSSVRPSLLPRGSGGGPPPAATATPGTSPQNATS